MNHQFDTVKGNAFMVLVLLHPTRRNLPSLFLLNFVLIDDQWEEKIFTHFGRGINPHVWKKENDHLPLRFCAEENSSCYPIIFGFALLLPKKFSDFCLSDFENSNHQIVCRLFFWFSPAPVAIIFSSFGSEKCVSPKIFIHNTWNGTFLPPGVSRPLPPAFFPWLTTIGLCKPPDPIKRSLWTVGGPSFPTHRGGHLIG